MILYELGGHGDLRYSTFSWRSHLALRHKGLDFELRPVRISDKAAIAFSGQKNVPILIDGDTVVVDSWKIAEHLEDRFPDRPSLFGSGSDRRLTKVLNSWADGQLVPALVPYLGLDVLSHLDPEDGAHLRGRFERFFGAPLETLAAQRPERLAAFRRLLAPLRDLLKGEEPFVGGAAPTYADYIVLSVLLWARLVSKAQVLEPEDPVHAWFERMLDTHGGCARRACAASPQPA